jgi:D-alanine-D-alanine ligase
MTYDLRAEYLNRGFGEEETAEFESGETIDAIDSTLVDLGHRTDRIGRVDQLIARLAAGQRWDLVFNIAEGFYGFGREAQVPALLEAFAIPYTFSDSLMLALGLHKGMTKRVVRDLGIPTPDFRVIQSESEARTIDLPYPLFAKPVAGGTSIGVSGSSKAQTPEQLLSLCRRLLDEFRQPVLVESFLPGRELTAGIVGTGKRARVLGVMEILLNDDAEPDAYSYANKKYYEARVHYALAADQAATTAAALALRIWQELGCRDAGRVDFRCDAVGAVQFLEINALAGLHPVHSDIVILCRMLGIPYRDLIQTIIESASDRISARASAVCATLES